MAQKNKNHIRKQFKTQMNKAKWGKKDETSKASQGLPSLDTLLAEKYEVTYDLVRKKQVT